MVKTQCGGIKLDGVTLKTIEGVICEANTLLIDTDKLITPCGNQQWDGDSFKIVKVGSSPVVTYCPSDETVIGNVIKMKASCGVGVDKRFFSLNSNKELVLVSGYLLKVNVTPADATVTVLDASSQEIEEIEGTVHQYICSGTVSVTVQKDGYEGKSQTVVMTENTEIDVELDKVWTLTVNVIPNDATIVVTQNEQTITPTPVGSNTYICHEMLTVVTASKTGYVTHTEQGEMVRDKTIDIVLQEEG